MGREYLLERQQLIRKPLSEVFQFFSDAANLEIITPPWLYFKILTPQPIPMQTGTTIDYRIRLCGVPLRWRTLIDTFEPQLRFSDTQLRGPYQYWHHLHEFQETSQGVLMTDRVRYAIPYGPLGEFARWLFVRRQLDQIFDYRFKKIDELFAT
jgi:ligand-binding SRPBCC domain-containing protein